MTANKNDTGKLLSSCSFRGLLWTKTLQGDTYRGQYFVVAYVYTDPCRRYFNLATIETFGDVSQLFTVRDNGILQLASFYARRALDKLTALPRRYFSYDDIPWEIHQIDDPDAYREALRAYQRGMSLP